MCVQWHKPMYALLGLRPEEALPKRQLEAFFGEAQKWAAPAKTQGLGRQGGRGFNSASTSASVWAYKGHCREHTCGWVHQLAIQ